MSDKGPYDQLESKWYSNTIHRFLLGGISLNAKRVIPTADRNRNNLLIVEEPKLKSVLLREIIEAVLGGVSSKSVGILWAAIDFLCYCGPKWNVLFF